jgi:hypothetical protein
MMPLFFQEGDILIFISGLFHKYYYVYDTNGQKELILLKERQPEQYYLPVEAARFLSQTDRGTWGVIIQLYRLERYDKMYGIFDNDKFYELGSITSPRKNFKGYFLHVNPKDI